jgi:hypothetical protein
VSVTAPRQHIRDQRGAEVVICVACEFAHDAAARGDVIQAHILHDRCAGESRCACQHTVGEENTPP